MARKVSQDSNHLSGTQAPRSKSVQDLRPKTKPEAIKRPQSADVFVASKQSPLKKVDSQIASMHKELDAKLLTQPIYLKEREKEFILEADLEVAKTYLGKDNKFWPQYTQKAQEKVVKSTQENLAIQSLIVSKLIEDFMQSDYCQQKLEPLYEKRTKILANVKKQSL